MANNLWTVREFGSCANLIRQIVDPQAFPEEPYIGLEHIEQSTLRLAGHGKAGDVQSSKFRFTKGDILFGKLRPYFRKVVSAPFNGLCSTDIWVVRSKKGVDQDFLYYLMASWNFVNDANRASEGTKMPRAIWDYVAKLKYPIPSEIEQRAIAHILSSLDQKIDLNRRMNESLEGIARAIFKSWFIDFDPVRAKAEERETKLPQHIADLFPDSFVDSELGEIPREWQIISLDHDIDYLNGLALQKYPPIDNNVLPVIKIAQLHKGNSEGADLCSAFLPPKYILKDGDVIFSWSGSLEVVIWCGGIGALNQHLFKVTSIRYPKWFYYFWTRHYLQEFQEIAAGKATTMGHIQRYHLSNAKILVPPKKLLSKMDSVLSPLIESFILNATQSRNLISLRDTLLPRLISGQQRIPDVESIIGKIV